MKSRKLFLTVVVVFSLTCAVGCSWPRSAHTYESYHPIVKGLTVYPGMRTRQQFYSDTAEFWKKAKDQKPTVEDLLQRTYDLDTVLEAREAQIRAYNEWAAEQNKRHDYAPREF